MKSTIPRTAVSPTLAANSAYANGKRQAAIIVTTSHTVTTDISTSASPLNLKRFWATIIGVQVIVSKKI